MNARLGLSVVAAALVAACGATQAPASTTRAPVTPASSAHGPAPSNDEWASLSWEERHDVMTWSLLPAMMPVMQRTFATKDPELTCRTCHGANAEAVAYKMPNGLPPLDPAHLPTGKIADAMRRDVTPLLSDILSKAETCFSCHPSAKGAP